MTKNKTRIFLHIGRNKAGSTSLQNFFLAQRDQLAARGLCYRPFGHLMSLTPDEPGFATHLELAEHARSNQYDTYLVSNEVMSVWDDSYTRRLVDDLNEFDVTGIYYLRPYPDWVSSDYSQAVKGGLTNRDFDNYLDFIEPRISAWPNLEGWGAALGWNRLRIRSLHSSDLVGGDLISDCLSAMNQDVTLTACAQRSNQTLHWTVLETLRLLVEGDSDFGWNEDASRVAVALGGLMEQCVARHPVPSIDYLTTEQSRRLAGLYNSDIDRIAERTGIQLQPQVPIERSRTMLPSFDRIPLILLQDWAVHAAAPDFRAEHPEAAVVAQQIVARRTWIRC